MLYTQIHLKALQQNSGEIEHTEREGKRSRPRKSDGEKTKAERGVKGEQAETGKGDSEMERERGGGMEKNLPCKLLRD